MTNTAKDNETPATLVWTGKKEWGSTGNTYRAEADGWRYCIDSPQKGQWVLRGWGPDGVFLYRDGHTMKGLKEQASEHLGVQRAKTAPAPVQTIEPVQEVPLIELRLPATATDGMTGVADAIAVLAARVQRATAAIRSMPQPCGCPTPTHRMSCGVGGRVVTRPKPMTLLADEGAALLDDIDDQCVDGRGDVRPEHDFDDVECRRCGAQPDDLS